jgi:hypothetical protein
LAASGGQSVDPQNDFTTVAGGKANVRAARLAKSGLGRLPGHPKRMDAQVQGESR